MDFSGRNATAHRFVVGIFVALALVQAAIARDGDPLSSFGARGRVQLNFVPNYYIGFSDTLHMPVVAQPDGKIVVAATVKGPASDDFGVVRLNANGSRDTSFGPSHAGQIIVPFDLGGTDGDLVDAMTLDAHGNLLIAGDADGDSFGGADCAVLRLTPDGLPDPTFNADGKSTVGFDLGPPGQRSDVCTKIAMQQDGKILLTGFAQTGTLLGSGDTPTYRIVLARLTTNGARDSTFNGNGVVGLDLDTTYPVAFGLGIVEQSDGHIVVVGDAATPSFDRLFVMARLNSDGSADAGFGSNGVRVFGPALNGYDHGDLTDVIALPDGTLVVTGFAYPEGSTNADFYFARIRTDGSLDPEFGSNGNTSVPIDLGGTNTEYGFALARDSRGRFIANGLATTSSGDAMALVRLTPDGQLDATFGNAGVETISTAPSNGIEYSEIGAGIAISAHDVIVASSMVQVDSAMDQEIGVVELIGDTVFSDGFDPS